MASTFTPPNFHEDQPSSLETTLASQIGARNPMGALGMLIPEMQRRQDAQADYHNYMAGINQQQAATLQSNQRLDALKEYSGLMQHALPGSLASTRQMFSDLIPGVNPELDAAIQQRSDSANAANLGKGNEGGIVPGASATPNGFSVTDPQNVRAAQIRAGSELGAARIKANSDKEFKVTVPIGDTNMGIAGGNAVLTGDAGRQYIKEHPVGVDPNATSRASPTQTNQLMSALHAKDPVAWKNVVDGGGRSYIDPQRGVVLIGKDGTKYH